MESRTKNTKRNMVSGIVKQLVNMVLPFLIRTIVIYRLGTTFQGLTGLFSSILQVLNLTELGFSTSVMYILYKPIAENNTESICSIINYLKKVYTIVGTIILTAGMLIMPFLPRLISGDIPEDINIYLLFLLYLLNTVISYLLFAYKSVLLNAMQREDIVSNISTVTTVFTRIVQIVLLLLFNNYYIYALVIPIGTIINNILLQFYSSKLFPQIIPQGSIVKSSKKELSKQVKAIFIGRLGDVSRNAFDNIALSLLLGLTTITIYDNYYYIYSTIYAIMLAISHAMQASVGNSIAKESVEKNRNDLKILNFLFMYIVGFCTICLACLYQPFMRIWMNNNESMMLSEYNMLLFCFYFYAINTNNIRNLYVNGCGLYYECRIWFVIEALGNLILNFTLGYFFGVTGILMATIVTIILLNFIVRTNVLFKNYFKETAFGFYKEHLFYLSVTIIAGLITYLTVNFISVPGISGFILKMICTCVVSNLIYLIAYYRTDIFKDSASFIKDRVLLRH